MRVFSFLLIVMLFVQCKSDAGKKSVDVKPNLTIPALPEQELKNLVFNCTSVDYIFKELPISISFGKEEGLETNIFFASLEAPKYDAIKCKSIARKIYNIGTEIYLEAEVFFDGTCSHYDFYKNGKLVYRSQITQQGISFYNNVIAQAKQGPPSQ
ncbi:MAG TPA: hypothetical protein PLY70_16500 [Saprospiraceae bacterium]|nr:hypothetical protein [Saprospiraceae bacterium]